MDDGITLDQIVERVKVATNAYKSNSLNGKEKYYAKYDMFDAGNIIRFMKAEATNWGCTGYTDIYVITIDAGSYTYDGGDAGRVAHKPVDLDYLFPVKQYLIGDWRPHWKQGLNISESSESLDSYIKWDGETLNRNTIPIPNQPHNLSELAYPNHMVSDTNESVWTCTCQMHRDTDKDKDGGGSGVRLILYDFDQTITSVHLYHELRGGQLKELSRISDERLIEIFGGNERIKRLDEHFEILTKNNVKLGILSFGFTKVIETALNRVNLLNYFRRLLDVIQNHYNVLE